MSIDLVEPYVCFSHSQVRSVAASPSSMSTPSTPESKNSTVALSTPFLDLRWYVGGAHTVDKTFLTLSRAPVGVTVGSKTVWSQFVDLLPSDILLDDILLTSNSNSNNNGKNLNRNTPRLISPVFTGKSRWYGDMDQQVSHNTNDKDNGNLYGSDDPLRPKHQFIVSLNLSRIFSHRKRKLSDPTAVGLNNLDLLSSSSLLSTGSHADALEHVSPASTPNAGDSKFRSTSVKAKSSMASGVSGMHDRLRRYPRHLEDSSIHDNVHARYLSVSGNTNSSSSVSAVRGKYWIVAWAMVDQDYGNRGQGYPRDSGPMSYYANIRTKSETKCVVTGPDKRTCQGRRYWPSDFMEIEIGEDGNIVHMRHVLHCATWTMPTHTSTLTLMSSLADGVEDSSLPHHYAPKPPIPSLQPDIDNSYSFERSYIFSFLILVFAGFSVWQLAGYWRRHRIYATVMSNKYLKLPTGFRSSPFSYSSSLSASSSTSSISSSQSLPPSPHSSSPKLFDVETIAESTSAMIV